MVKQKTIRPLLIFLAIAALFAFTACEKIKVSNLKANNHFNMANEFYRDGQYRKAIEEYNKTLEFNPNLTQAYRLLGESYKNLYKHGVDTPENTERANRALEALKKAYEIDPDNKDIIYSLGDMYDKLRDFEEAEKLYLKILEMEPTNMGNYYVVAQFYQRYSGGTEEKTEIGETTPFKKAEEMYLRRIELDPENPEGYAFAAQFYDDAVNRAAEPALMFEKARFFHQLRLKDNPDNAEVWYAIGVNRWSKAYRLQNVISIEEQKKLAEESHNALQKAIELDPSYPEPYAYMSVLNQSLRARLEPEKASRYITEADQYQARFQEAQKKRADRRRLEQELRGIR